MLKPKRGFISLIGIEYDKLNCWGLVEVFYDIVFDIELKHYFDEAPEDRGDIKNLIYTNIGDFEEILVPEFGDLALIKVHGVESHVAVVVDNGMILHTTKGTGSVLDRLDRWDKTVAGYYRLKVIEQ